MKLYPLVSLGAFAVILTAPVQAATMLRSSPVDLTAAPVADAVASGAPSVPPQNFIYDGAHGPVVFEAAIVPEPSSWFMIFGGIGLIGGMARRDRGKIHATKGVPSEQP